MGYSTENEFRDIDPDKNIFDFYSFISEFDEHEEIIANTLKLSENEKKKEEKTKSNPRKSLYVN